MVQVPNFSILWWFWGIKVCLRVYLYQFGCNINYTGLSTYLCSGSILLLIGKGRRWGGEPCRHIGGNSQSRGLDVRANVAHPGNSKETHVAVVQWEKMRSKGQCGLGYKDIWGVSLARAIEAILRNFAFYPEWDGGIVQRSGTSDLCSTELFRQLCRGG